MNLDVLNTVAPVAAIVGLAGVALAGVAFTGEASPPRVASRDLRAPVISATVLVSSSILIILLSPLRTKRVPAFC